MKSKLILLLAVACCLLAVRAEAQTYAITNARIVTVAGAPIDKGTVVLRNGLIDSVGANIKVPADAVIIDGSGYTVYPGFIDALTNLGVQASQPRPAAGAPQVPGSAQQATTPTSNSNYPAGLRPEDSVAEDLKAGEAQFEAARNAGFTTVLTVNRAGIFNGKSA